MKFVGIVAIDVLFERKGERQHRTHLSRSVRHSQEGFVSAQANETTRLDSFCTVATRFLRDIFFALFLSVVTEDQMVATRAKQAKYVDMGVASSKTLCIVWHQLC